MKRILAILTAVLALGLVASAESKVVEKSAKKAPEWISEAVESHLVVSVQAPSIAEAQRKAETAIAERMINAVARNITTSSTNVASEVVTDGSDVASTDSYTINSVMRSANLPFLKGITLAKADGVYWVKMRDKQTKAEYYDYYVKYPFFRAEQAALIAEFEEYDATKDAEYASLEDGLATVDTEDGIKGAISQLEALQKYYFDDVRRSKALALAKRYKELDKSVVMNGEVVGAGKVRISFELLGHEFKVYQAPKVTSNCASAIRVKADNGAFVVTYSTEDCIEDEENYLDVSARVGSRKFKDRISITVDGQ